MSEATTHHVDLISRLRRIQSLKADIESEPGDSTVCELYRIICYAERVVQCQITDVPPSLDALEGTMPEPQSNKDKVLAIHPEAYAIRAGRAWRVYSRRGLPAHLSSASTEQLAWMIAKSRLTAPEGKGE